MRMAIVTDEIAHLAIAGETLDQRDVDAAGRFAPAATNGADVAINDRKECSQSFAPLVDELLAMNQHQRVAAPGRNHFCTDDGLAKRRRGGQHAVVMGLDGGDGCRLDVVQLAEKRERQWLAAMTFVLQDRFEAQGDVLSSIESFYLTNFDETFRGDAQCQRRLRRERERSALWDGGR